MRELLKWRSLALVLALLSAWMAQPARAGEACTWGTDCPRNCWYNREGANFTLTTGNDVPCTGTNTGLTCANTACRDKRGGNGIPIRTSAVGGVGAIVFAEDFENPAYTNHTAASGGWYADGPAFNPPDNFRGDGSAWFARYGWAGHDCNIREGQPSPVTVGVQCNTTTGQGCSTEEWTSGANMQATPSGGSGDSDAGACMDIFNASTEPHNSEAPSIGIPDCPGPDGLSGTGDDIANCGPFDGNQAMRYRNPAGGATGGLVTDDDPTNNFESRDSYYGTQTNIGVTLASAYYDDTGTSNIFTGPGAAAWKHEEFAGSAPAPAEMEYWVNGDGAIGHGGPAPVGGFLFVTAGQNTNFDSVTGSARCRIGSINANPFNNYSVGLTTAGFSQAANWPWGDWGCTQASMTSMGTACTGPCSVPPAVEGTRIQKWFNGTQILDCNVSGNLMRNTFYSKVVFGNYANQASDNNGASPGSAVNQLSGRDLDNFVITNGTPVSCAEIGSAGGVVGGTPTYTVDTLTPTPANCISGDSACNAVALVATGTVSGGSCSSMTWERRCKATDSFVTVAGCTNPASCNLTACSYSGQVPAVYAPEVRANCGGASGQPVTRTASFTVQNAPPATNTGQTFALNEPTQDVNNRNLQTLQNCEVKRFVDGILVDTVFRPASSPQGGGTWPTAWAADLLADPARCGGRQITGQATCTNSKGKSAVSSPTPVATPACPEGVPKPPTFSMLGQLLERLYAPTWSAGLQ